MTTHYVYHIPHPKHQFDLSLGYIGVTNKTPQRRFAEHVKGSRSIISKAIKSYGITDVVTIASFDSAIEAYRMELILRPFEKMGWNQAPGGIGGSRGPISDETRAKRRLISLGEKNNFYGKTHSDDSRVLISNALLNKDQEWRSKNASNAGKANKGKFRTEDSKKNYKQAASLRPQYTCPNCNKVGQYNSMIAWHGNNCKSKTKYTLETTPDTISKTADSKFECDALARRILTPMTQAQLKDTIDLSTLSYSFQKSKSDYE